MAEYLSEDLRLLDDFLLNEAGDEAMLLSELDGFLAGVIVIPELIKPSEWLPLVWGGEDPGFDDLHQAQSVLDLIMKRYNQVVAELNRGDYRPLYDHDSDDSILWETWIDGFWKASGLREDTWLPFAESGDETVLGALFGLMRLYEIGAMAFADREPQEDDEEMAELAPDLIPKAVEILHRARLDLQTDSNMPVARHHPKIGRNDPCPCGSGKKFKKCCLH